ncbi:hypothetical protein PHMEG_00030296 [Phytophthora megakarya]|uniref:Uncharacterized protein n=1 Tax=Phytophthora megakarya TaxID=4795 RepID=A0A225V0Y0_9STRA|nr:hypothetical protein PHMEG_00030296 [Phytophthora megakarya]
MVKQLAHLIALEAEVSSARASTIKANSRSSYRSSMTRFLRWMIKNKRPLLTVTISFSTYAGHRSAFYNLFQDYHKVMSAELEREISCHHKGLQRQVATAINQG